MSWSTLAASWAFADADSTSNSASNSASSDTFCIQLISGSNNNVAPSNEISKAYASGISAIAVLDSSFRLGVLTGNKWENGKTLTVAFFGGSSTLQRKVKDYASEWMQYANIKFQFVSGRTGDIRVAFSGQGGVSQSYVGTGNRNISSTQPTMQLGISDNSSDTHIRRVTLHEFGHAIGCVHEHSQPNANIAWDRQAVINDHRGIWDQATVEHNIFYKYTNTQVQASSFDAYSIMLYPIPARWTKGTFTSQWNTTLSQKDKEFIGKVYPFDNVNPVRPPVTTRPDLLSNGSYYNIINTATSSGLSWLDVSAYDNKTVQGYQNNGGYLNQKWIAKGSGNIWVFQNARTGTYLSAPSAQAHGPVVVSSSQTPWCLTPRNQSNKQFSLALVSQPSFVMDLTGSNWANETPVIMYPWYATANQIWEFNLTSRGNLT